MCRYLDHFIKVKYLCFNLLLMNLIFSYKVISVTLCMLIVDFEHIHPCSLVVNTLNKHGKQELLAHCPSYNNL